MLASLWSRALAAYGPRTVEAGGLMLVQMLAFWLPAAAFQALDWAAPRFSARHKLQPAPRQPTAAELRECAAVVLRNNALAGGLGGVALWLGSSPASSGPRLALRVEEALPPAGEVLRDVLVCCALREVLFYYAHRLLHTPRWYRRVHKTHHRFAAPVALAAQYAHPAEHLVANVLPVALPPLLLRAHVLTGWLFVALMLVETATVHSGYDFLGGAARMHDAHHEHFTRNYGVFGLMDWLHGTGGRPGGGAAAAAAAATAVKAEKAA